MYDYTYIHEPVRQIVGKTIVVLLRTSIPEFLMNSKAVDVVNGKVCFDSESGYQTAPLGSVIGYAESDQTPSGYNCWFVAKLSDLSEVDGVFYTKPHTIYSMLIPSKEEVWPVWVHSSGLTHNDDGTATLLTAKGTQTGRVGIDFLISYGMKKNGKPDAYILRRTDDSYKEYIVCDENGEDVGKLCDLYPV